MTDNCKFCKAYMDPIGCDTKKDVAGGTWCGQCAKGRKALYGAWGTWEVEALRDAMRKQYEEDPIKWDAKPPKGESRKRFLARHSAHLHRLWLSDLCQTLDRVLEDRKKED